MTKLKLSTRFTRIRSFTVSLDRRVCCKVMFNDFGGIMYDDLYTCHFDTVDLPVLVHLCKESTDESPTAT